MPNLFALCLGATVLVATAACTRATPTPSASPSSRPPASVASSASPSGAPASADAYAGWKTYTSSLEKASFRYPADWKVVAPRVPSSAPSGADATSLMSPNGTVTIDWTSFISGLGGGCSPGECPIITVLDKTPIPGAAGLYVVSGVESLNGKFHAWMAVTGSNGLLASTNSRMDYTEYPGRHNGALPALHGENGSALFNICGIGASGGPTFPTRAEATNFLATPTAQQAKQILLSLSY